MPVHHKYEISSIYQVDNCVTNLSKKLDQRIYQVATRARVIKIQFHKFETT